MSKEFKPIFTQEQPKVQDFKDDIIKLKEEKEKAEERLRELERKLASLEKENRELLEELKSLRAELEERERKLEEAIRELKNSQTASKTLEELKEKIQSAFDKVKEELREDFLHLAKEVIKSFLLSDQVPKEEVVTKILKEVFERSIELKGSVRIVLNPSDMERVFDFIAGLKEKLGDKIDVEVVGSQELEPGELRIETPKFIIERKHEEIFEEVFKEVVEHVFERS